MGTVRCGRANTAVDHCQPARLAGGTALDVRIAGPCSGERLTTVWVLTFVIAGVLMGLTTGAVTGIFLLRLTPVGEMPADGSR